MPPFHLEVAKSGAPGHKVVIYLKTLAVSANSPIIRNCWNATDVTISVMPNINCEHPGALLHHCTASSPISLACWEVSVRQWGWIQRVLAAALIAVVQSREAFAPLRRSLPFELSLRFSSLHLSLTHLNTHFSPLHLPYSIPLNAYSIMRSFLYCQGLSTNHL